MTIGMRIILCVADINQLNFVYKYLCMYTTDLVQLTHYTHVLGR